MHRIRVFTGALALLALASSAVADAPSRMNAAGSVAVCSTAGGACPLQCGPCPEPCPRPCASGEAAAASLDAAQSPTD